MLTYNWRDVEKCVRTSVLSFFHYFGVVCILNIVFTQYRRNLFKRSGWNVWVWLFLFKSVYFRNLCFLRLFFIRTQIHYLLFFGGFNLENLIKSVHQIAGVELQIRACYQILGGLLFVLLKNLFSFPFSLLLRVWKGL